MKKTKSQRSRLPNGAAEAIAAVGIFFAVVLVIILIKLLPNGDPVQGKPQESTADEPELLASSITLPMPLADGVSLTGLYAVDAMFPEDGSNILTENLLCAVVRNDSAQTLEYMAFTLHSGDTDYEFSVTTLPPSCEVYAFEKNASQAPGKISELTADVQVQLFFAEEPSLMEDQVEITVHDGSIDVKNITGQPTDREIQVYYKNTENLAYFGGITYFLRVPEGLQPGESYNGYAANASKSRTEVMFVKYGN